MNTTVLIISHSLVQLLERTSQEKNEALQRKAASLEDQLKRQKVNNIIATKIFYQ